MDFERPPFTRSSGLCALDAVQSRDLPTFYHARYHMCIVQTFAKAELPALVVTLVRAFEIELAYPDRPVISVGIIATKPEGGLWIKLKRD